MPCPSGRPQARPTIFWAKVKPLPVSAGCSGVRNRVDGSRPKDSRALLVKLRPMIRLMRPPARTSSSSTGVFSLDLAICVPSLKAATVAFVWSIFRVISSPMFISVTSISTGNAPASSMVLKKMGAILPPKHTPPSFLFGMWGISSPKNHNTELVADLRLEPVPTTSPT